MSVPCSFINLPEAILVELLSYFSIHDFLQLELVNHAWADAIHQCGVWKSITLVPSSIPTFISMQYVLYQIAHRHGSCLRQLTILQTEFAPLPYYFKSLSQLLTNLERVTIYDSLSMSDDQLGSLLNASKYSLTHISIIKCPGVTNKFLETIALENQPLMQLKVLDISHCRGITGDGIESYFSCFPNLEFVGLQYTPKINNNVIQTLTRCCKHLKILKIGGSARWSDQTLEILSNGSCQLEILDISHSTPFGDRLPVILEATAPLMNNIVTSAGLIKFAKCAGKNLKRLSLRGHNFIDLAILEGLAEFTPNLELLELGGRCHSSQLNNYEAVKHRVKDIAERVWERQMEVRVSNAFTFKVILAPRKDVRNNSIQPINQSFKPYRHTFILPIESTIKMGKACSCYEVVAGV